MTAARSIRPDRSAWDFVHPTLDAACILASLAGIKWLARGWVNEAAVGMGLVAVVVFLLASQLTGLCRCRSQGTSADREMLLIASTWALTVLTLALLGFATRYGELFARSVVAAWIVAAPCLIGLSHMGAQILQHSLLKRGVGIRRLAIAGLNDLGLETAEKIADDPGLGLRLVGFFDDRAPRRLSGRTGTTVSLEGDLAELVRRARCGQVETILITLPMRAESRIRYVLDQLSDSTVSVYIVPDFFVFELLHSRWINMGGLPAVSVFENPFYGVDGVVKRLADFALATAALAIAAVPMMLIAAAVKLSSPGPVFFRQRRYGLDGREIRVWKFRSMRTCDDGAVVKQATQGDRRVTPVGALLRKTSLDELPQLFNVIEGSMSLVGPRPHATAHNEQFRGLIRGYMLRHKVKPGITGLAQVCGCRGETDTLEKMQRRVDLDHQYIRQWSIGLDLKILVRTLWVAWRQPEAY